jgi:hypothetical protein
MLGMKKENMKKELRLKLAPKISGRELVRGDDY